VKLCECLAILEANVAKWNGLARLCVVYSKADRGGADSSGTGTTFSGGGGGGGGTGTAGGGGISAAIARVKQLLRLNELFHFSSVNVTEVVFGARTREGVGELLSWIQSTYISK
jgi:hypothetical protein